ncbi:Cbb3-type cytochrome c oxidase subunit CcoN1 [compost metagenome]
MWRAVNEDGTLTYSFVEALEASHPGFVVRMIGGVFLLTGMFLMAWNTWRTVRVGNVSTTETLPQAMAHG